MRPRFIIIHCSAADGSTLESMTRYHTAPKPDGKGWADVGYHFVVEESGAIRHGRPLDRNGAHAKGANNNIGVCLAGDLDAHPANWDQIRSLERLCRALMLAFNIAVEHVIGHREVNTHIPSAARVRKSCPGTWCDMDAWRAYLA
jgi:N-acetyl-anhydromuramyl-L-alanine amidase AmpD